MNEINPPSEYLIKPFSDEDISQAIVIIENYWADEIDSDNDDLNHYIHAASIHKYDLNRKYSFSVYHNNELCGFILAGKKGNKNKQPINDKYTNVKLKNFELEEQKKASEYQDFFDVYSKQLNDIVTDNDLIINLFISVKKGCGRILLNHISTICKQEKIDNIYLWSDQTCNIDFYYHCNFQPIKKILNDHMPYGGDIDVTFFKTDVNR